MRQDDGDRIYWAGYGPDAYCQVTVKSDKIAFGGVSWLAASREDLINATKIPVRSTLLPRSDSARLTRDYLRRGLEPSKN